MPSWPEVTAAGPVIGVLFGLFGVGGSSFATPVLGLLGVPGLMLGTGFGGCDRRTRRPAAQLELGEGLRRSLAEPVPTDVDADAREPRSEAGRLSETAEAEHGLQACLLGRVLHQFRGSKNPLAQRHEEGPVACDDYGERLPVALTRRSDEARVVGVDCRREDGHRYIRCGRM
jgi:hypothetical protein